MTSKVDPNFILCKSFQDDDVIPASKFQPWEKSSHGFKALNLIFFGSNNFEIWTPKKCSNFSKWKYRKLIPSK